MNLKRGEYILSTDRNKLDHIVIHHYLSTEAYWSPGITMETVIRASEHSLCFGVYHGDHQVGYARVISDFTTMAYLADVFILPDHRGHGLGKWLVESIKLHPDLQGLRRWILVTRDAHGLYEQYGWQRLAQPELYMEMHRSTLRG